MLGPSSVGACRRRLVVYRRWRGAATGTRVLLDRVAPGGRVMAEGLTARQPVFTSFPNAGGALAQAPIEDPWSPDLRSQDGGRSTMNCAARRRRPATGCRGGPRKPLSRGRRSAASSCQPTASSSCRWIEHRHPDLALSVMGARPDGGGYALARLRLFPARAPAPLVPTPRGPTTASDDPSSRPNHNIVKGKSSFLSSLFRRVLAYMDRLQRILTDDHRLRQIPFIGRPPSPRLTSPPPALQHSRHASPSA